MCVQCSLAGTSHRVTGSCLAFWMKRSRAGGAQWEPESVREGRQHDSFSSTFLSSCKSLFSISHLPQSFRFLSSLLHSVLFFITFSPLKLSKVPHLLSRRLIIFPSFFIGPSLFVRLFSSLISSFHHRLSLFASTQRQIRTGSLLERLFFSSSRSSVCFHASSLTKKFVWDQDRKVCV